MTFRDFMQVALYDEELGYYNTQRPKIGAAGDYYTSSNVHPAFGAVLARAFVELWAGSGEPLTIVEMGPGTGQLAADVLTILRDEYPATFYLLKYILVESSPVMRSHQQDKLTAFESCVSWYSLDQLELSPVRGIVFSNEFVDALPVHRVRRVDEHLEEQYVSANGPDGLRLVWQEPSSKRLGEYTERMAVPLRHGQIIEINIDALDWLSRIKNAVERGLLVTIDYGDIAPRLWTSNRKSGTLRSFHLHNLTDSVLELVGEQDITSSVNFTALIEYGRDFGFEFVSYERQTAFLTRFGLIERIASRHAASESLDDLQERLAVKNLFVPGGISDGFRVLIQRR